MSLMKIDNMSFAYSTDGIKILEHVNAEFEEGKIYALVGRSGAGKTTLLSLLAALTSPSEGSIWDLINKTRADQVSSWVADAGSPGELQ